MYLRRPLELQQGVLLQKNQEPLPKKVTEASEPLSIIKSGMGNSRNLASGNPLPLSPPITVLIKNLTLEGNEWLEALKNMSLDLGPSSQAHRGSDTLKSDLSSGDSPISKASLLHRG
jgi:hypothetical protein